MKQVKETSRELRTILESSIQWNEKSRKEKAICIWFALSFFLLFVSGPIWFVILAVANLAVSSYFMKKHVSISEEDGLEWRDSKEDKK